MNAVLDKPRTKAKPKAAKSALQTRLDSIFSKLKLGQEKLQLAHQSVAMTDPGDAADVLLLAVIEDMLPLALEPMYRQPLTRADADAAYTGMFTSLAAIDGAIALSRGQVIEPMLREAWVLLDEANSQMDFSDLPGLPETKNSIKADLLPLREDLESAAPGNATNDSSPRVDAAERIFEARWTWNCATEILDHYTANSGSDLDFAALELAQVALKKLSAADDDHTKALCEEASGAMSSAVAVARACSKVSDDPDEQEALILAGVHKLFEMALSILDEATLALAVKEPNE